MTTKADAQVDMIVASMCNAIEAAEGLYCEILAQRYAGMAVMGRSYDKLAELDRLALRTVEAYCRMTQEATR